MSLVTREARPRAVPVRKVLPNESTDDFSNRNRYSELGIKRSRIIILHIEIQSPCHLV